jgi:hypothetical protein
MLLNPAFTATYAIPKLYPTICYYCSITYLKDLYFWDVEECWFGPGYTSEVIDESSIDLFDGDGMN